jgi:O-acetyl-ADP-ribose deacetylase (regulator of RNase III)
MKIEYIKNGDIYKAPESFTIQGCNAQGVMGSGVAKLWRDHDENIFTVYRKTYEEKGLKVGDIVPVATKHPVTGELEGLIVINAITQEFYGRDDSRRYASYDGIQKAFFEADQMVFAYSGLMASSGRPMGDKPRVSIPQIGAGLANGRWPIIAAIIETTVEHFQPVVYLLPGASIE